MTSQPPATGTAAYEARDHTTLSYGKHHSRPLLFLPGGQHDPVLRSPHLGHRNPALQHGRRAVAFGCGLLCRKSRLLDCLRQTGLPIDWHRSLQQSLMRGAERVAGGAKGRSPIHTRRRRQTLRHRGHGRCRLRERNKLWASRQLRRTTQQTQKPPHPSQLVPGYGPFPARLAKCYALAATAPTAFPRRPATTPPLCGSSRRSARFVRQVA